MELWNCVELIVLHDTQNKQARSLKPPPLHSQEAGHLKEALVTVTMEPSCR